MGRPRRCFGEPASEFVSYRLTTAEAEALETAAELSGIGRNEYARRVTLGHLSARGFAPVRAVRDAAPLDDAARTPRRARIRLRAAERCTTPPNVGGNVVSIEDPKRVSPPQARSSLTPLAEAEAEPVAAAPHVEDELPLDDTGSASAPAPHVDDVQIEAVPSAELPPSNAAPSPSAALSPSAVEVLAAARRYAALDPSAPIAAPMLALEVHVGGMPLDDARAALLELLTCGKLLPVEGEDPSGLAPIDATGRTICAVRIAPANEG